MQKKALWLVYDFDLGGDFEGLYKWLDSRGAIECGNSVSFLNFEFNNDFYKELKSSLETAVNIQKKDRIYIIYSDARKMRGKFLSGERKKNPWAGYAVEGGKEEELADE